MWVFEFLEEKGRHLLLHVFAVGNVFDDHCEIREGSCSLVVVRLQFYDMVLM